MHRVRLVARQRARVDAVLKGRSFETLISKTYDGLAIEPLYPPVSEARPIARNSRSAIFWIDPDRPT